MSESWFSEGSSVQVAQAMVWGLAAAVALSTAPRRPRPLDRGMAGWQGAVALLALARELDLHELLHAATPIHFRLRWLLESDASLWWKSAAVGIELLPAAVVLVPALLLPVPWRTLWQRRDPVLRLLAAALACLAAGYVLDDLVGRWAGVDRASTKIVEETLELGGAVAFWLHVEAERARPLTTRLAA